MDPKDIYGSHDELPYHQNPAFSSTSVGLDHGSSSPSLKAMCGPSFPGVLSLHHYRRYLSDSPSGDSDEIKKLRRKNAAFNLNQYQYQTQHPHPHPHHQPFAASSVASSPPPLSPSYSPSAWSEQSPESLDGFRLPGSPSPLDVNAEQIYYVHPSPSKHDAHRILDTFRHRLEKHPDHALPDETLPEEDVDADENHPTNPSPSPNQNTNPTIVHHGTAFEILNPRASLRFARIVSYIDGAYSSSPSSPDASLRTQSIDEEDEQPQAQPPAHAYHDLVGDSPHHPMPSISERLEEKDDEDGEEGDADLVPAPLVPRTSSPVSSLGSELGEPGPPVSEQEHGYRHDYRHGHGHGHEHGPEHGQGEGGDHSVDVWGQPPSYQAYGYGYDYVYGFDSHAFDGGRIPNPALLHGMSDTFPTPDDVVQIHRRLSRRAIADRRKGQNGNGGAFRRFCARLKRRRSS